ncbi:MAG: hypothetical protein IKP95_01555 [Ruminococcus sp.]|nr:hypothetical protein [Ruminococcus sp.]
MDTLTIKDTDECSLFACRVCRTKTGFPHQKWCSLYGSDKGSCGGCIYFDKRKKRCRHPRKLKDGDIP